MILAGTWGLGIIGNFVNKQVERAEGMQNRFLIWPGYICLVGLLSALYFGSLKSHLLSMDDHDAFQDNIAIGEDLTYFFSSQKQQPSGRPLAELVKFGAYLVWGNDPGYFHLLVVACHALVAILVARLAWRMGSGLGPSLVGGLLFLVNVAHFQAVHWIQAIEYPLALIWGLASLLFYLRYLSTWENRWLWGFYGSLLISILALSAMAFLWPFCLYWSWLQRYDLKTTLRHLLPLLFLVVLELAFIVAITPRENSTWRALGLYAENDLFIYLFGMVRLLLWMLSRLLTTAHWLPVRLYDQQPWELYAGVAVLAAMALLVYRKGIPQAPCSVWILLSVLPFLPLTDLIVLGRPEGPSRYLYPATVGSSLLLAWGLEAVRLRLRPWGRYFHPGIAGAIFISSYFSLKEAEAPSLYSQGRNYIARGDIETGVAQLKRAIAQGPNRIDLYDAYVRLCMQTLGTGEEEPILKAALSAFPEGPNLHIYKLVVDSMNPDSTIQHQTRKKLDAFKTSASQVRVEVETGNWLRFKNKQGVKQARLELARAYQNTGWKLEKRGKLEEAILAYRHALEFSPREKTYVTLAAVLDRAGFKEEAALIAFEAVKRYPQASSGLQIAASNVLLASGKLSEAIAMCHKAMGKEPLPKQVQAVFTLYQKILNGDFQGVNSTAYTQMGLDFWRRGKFDESKRAYRKALEEDEANSRAWFNLGLVCLTKGEVEEAERAYASAVERFGRGGAERAEAEEALRSLLDHGIQVEATRKILETYWSRR